MKDKTGSLLTLQPHFSDLEKKTYFIDKKNNIRGLIMNKLEDIIAEAIEYLQARENAKENVLSIARMARMFSKKSILMLHIGDVEGSKAQLDEAAKYLQEIQIKIREHPDMGHFDAVQSARQEFAESAILFQIINENYFPAPESINVSTTDYIMGLADVPGELRRQTLDRLREGDLTKAENGLAFMEEIYLALVQAEEASLLLKGLRRKIDITRMVNERTRSEITNEAGRQRLLKQLKNLGEKLENV
jgi:translin